jgi:hypothetical protein
VVDALKENNLIVDTISLGKSKFLGVTRLASDKPHRFNQFCTLLPGGIRTNSFF